MRIRRARDWSFLKDVESFDSLHLNNPRGLNFKELIDYELGFLSVFNPKNCNIDPISDIKSLEYLELTGCKINCDGLIKLLKGLRKLKYLRLDVNVVSDLSVLQQLEGENIQLDHLDLSFNKIVDIEPLKYIEVSKLVLDKNRISDISSIPNIHGLESISFDHCKVKDLKPLLFCPTITDYSSKGNPIRKQGETRYLFLR